MSTIDESPMAHQKMRKVSTLSCHKNLTKQAYGVVQSCQSWRVSLPKKKTGFKARLLKVMCSPKIWLGQQHHNKYLGEPDLYLIIVIYLTLSLSQVSSTPEETCLNLGLVKSWRNESCWLQLIKDFKLSARIHPAESITWNIDFWMVGTQF